jgi:hypothetical protein
MGISPRERAMPTGTAPMLVGVEAGHESRSLIAAAANLARRSHAQVLVLSVRERDYVRGFAWDVHQPGEIAATVSDAIYELQRLGVTHAG